VNRGDQIGRNTILFISHEASSTGAPRVLLNIMRWLRTHTDFRLRLLLRAGGPLEKEFRELAEVHMESAGWSDCLIRDVCIIYSNTGTNGLYLRTLPFGNIPVVTHLHELHQALQWFGPENLAATLAHTTHFIACSNAVKSMLEKDCLVNPAMVSMVPESIVPQEVTAQARAKSGLEVRRELGIGADQFMVVGCGNAEVRKGVDLFILLARECARKEITGKIAFVWVGPVGISLANNYYLQDLERLGLNGCVRFVGQMENPQPIIAACDLFCLPSREDPFPLVMLEAGALGKATLAFCGSGGAEEYCRKGNGFLVPYLDVSGMADCIERLARDRSELERAAHNARLSVENDFHIDMTGPAIEAILRRVALRADCLLAGAAQLFIPGAEGYSEQASIRKPVRAQQWNRLQFRFSASGACDPWILRFDPLDQTAIVEIARIVLKNRSDGALLWKAEQAQDFSALTVAGTAVRLPDTNRFTLLNLGADAMVTLPAITIAPRSSEYQLDVVLRADNNVHEIGKASQPLIRAYQEDADLRRALAHHQAALRLREEADETVRALMRAIAPARGRDLYIWGTGAAGRQIGALLLHYAQQFRAFIDPDPGKNGQSILDHPILSPQALCPANGPAFIIIGSQFHREIGSSLDDLGFVQGVDYATPAWLLGN
jgi:glycosyltransferase involved in cell wall biosynthesis